MDQNHPLSPHSPEHKKSFAVDSLAPRGRRQISNFLRLTLFFIMLKPTNRHVQTQNHKEVFSSSVAVEFLGHV